MGCGSSNAINNLSYNLIDKDLVNTSTGEVSFKNRNRLIKLSKDIQESIKKKLGEEAYQNIREKYVDKYKQEPYFIGVDPYGYLKIDKKFFYLYNYAIADKDIRSFIEKTPTDSKYFRISEEEGRNLFIFEPEKEARVNSYKSSNIHDDLIKLRKGIKVKEGERQITYLAKELYKLEKQGLIEVGLDTNRGDGIAYSYYRPLIQSTAPLNILSQAMEKDNIMSHLFEAVKDERMEQYQDQIFQLEDEYNDVYEKLQEDLSKFEEIAENYGLDTDTIISTNDYYNQSILAENHNDLLWDISLKQESLNTLSNSIRQLKYIEEEITKDENNELTFAPSLQSLSPSTSIINIPTANLNPVENNFEDARKFYENQIRDLNIRIRNLDKRLRMSYSDKDTILEEKIKLEGLKISYENTVSSLKKKSITQLYSALEKDIDMLTKDIEEYNFDLKLRDKIEFLNLMLTGKGNFNSNLQSNNESISQWIPEKYDALNKKLNDLNLLYTRTLPILGKKIVSEDINFINNLEGNLTEEEIEDLFKADRDIDHFSTSLLGISQSTTKEIILPQVLKSLLDTAKTEHDAIPKSMKDRLVKAAFALGKDHNYSWIFEKSEMGIPTGNIFNYYTAEFIEDLKKYRSIPNRSSLQDASEEEKVQAQLNWLRANTDMIDIRKLKWVKDMFNDSQDQIYSPYFEFSDSEMDSYEEHLKDLLGPAYEREMQKVRNKLSTLQKRTIQLLASGKQDVEKDLLASDPFSFIRNFYSNNPDAVLRGVDSKGNMFSVLVDTNIDNLFVIPKKEVEDFDEYGGITLKETNYFNKDFKSELEDNKKREYWEAITSLYQDYINPTYGKSNLASMSYGKMEESFWEIVASEKGLSKLYEGGKKIKDFLKSGFFLNQTDRIDNGVYANYTDAGDVRRNALRESYNTLTESKLRQELRKEGYNFPSDTSKRVLVRELANIRGLKGFSTDLNKVTLALTDLASFHAARQEVLPQAEVLLEYHKSITDARGNRRNHSIEKMENYINTIIRNQNSLNTSAKISETELFKSIFNRHDDTVINKLKNQTKFKNYSDADKEAIENFKKAKLNGHNPGDTSFSYMGVYYVSKKDKKGTIRYSRFDNKNGITPLDSSQFEDTFQEYLDFRIESLGVPMTIHSAAIGIQKLLIMKQMSFGFTSGIKNRVEGKDTNWKMDATGQFWTPGNIEVAENYLTGANLATAWDRLLPSTKGEFMEQHRLLRLLIEELDVIQDKKSEFEKQDSVNKKDYGKLFNVFQFAIDNPEYKNQAAIVISILMDTEIEDINGNKHPIFDKKTAKLVPYKIVDGQLVLKDEFNTEKNKITWGQFGVDRKDKKNNGFVLTKSKIKNAISRSQGNYEGTDTQLILNSTIGRIISTYKRWLPEHIMQRFNTNDQLDLITGKKRQVGRYIKVARNKGALLSTTVAFAGIGVGFSASFLGFLGLGALIAGGLYGYDKYMSRGKNTNNTDANQLMVFAEHTKSIILATLNYPLRYLHAPAKLRFDDSLNTNRTRLAEEDAMMLASVAREIAAILNFLALKVLIISLLWDDKDKEAKKMSYFYDNLLTSLIHANTIYLNPKALLDDSVKTSFLQHVNDVWKAGEILLDDDKDISQFGDHMMKMLLPNAGYRLATQGSLIKDKKDFKPGEFTEDISKDIISDENHTAKKKAKKVSGRIQEAIKDDLINEGYEENTTEFEEEFNRRKNKIIGKKAKGVTYVERWKELEEIEDEMD